MISALSLIAWATPAAQAKQYRAFICSDPKGGAIPLDPAQNRAFAFREYAGFIDTCSSGGPVHLFMGREPSWANYAQEELARWELVSPIPIAKAWITRSVVTTSDPRDNQGTPEYVAQTRSSVDGRVTSVMEHCIAAPTCQRGNPALGADEQNVFGWTMPPDKVTKVLEFSWRCGGQPWGTCATGGGGTRAGSAYHRVELELDDPYAPGGSDYSGTLLDWNAVTTAGTLGLKLVATDESTGSGVLAVVTKVDGVEVGRVRPSTAGVGCGDAGFRSEPDYRAIQPCPMSAQMETELDTRRFADGRHSVSVSVVDAALNERTIIERFFTFENFPAPVNEERPTIGGNAAEPRPTDALTALPGKWTGTAIKFRYEWQRSAEGGTWTPINRGDSATYTVHKDDVGHSLRVVVTASNSEGSTSAASSPTAIVKSGAVVETAGAPNAPGDATFGAGADPSTAQLVVDREQRTVEVNHGAKIVVTGRLVDANSQPIANATVDVFEQLVLTAAPWSKIGSVTTDSQGGYVFRPKTTASRRLRFAYSDRRDAADYRATREVLVSVRARMSISAKRKVLNPGGTIRLRGRVTVDSLPKTGTWVEVQVLDAGVWRTVATRKTSSKGLWTFKHRLRQSSGIQFRFRSRLRVVGDVASSEATSQPLKVRVR